MRIILLQLLFLLLSYHSISQTVGTIFNSETASDKLTLLNPYNSESSYLIDNCGFIYNTWNSNYTAGMAAQLDSDGSLFRLGRIPSDIFKGGGIGGIIEKFSWDGELLWDFTLADSSYHLHHDLELMPNGNILLIAWEIIDEERLLEIGRSNVIPDQLFYSEVILEVDPSVDLEVVWEWHAIDHIIQNTDNRLENFGQPENFIERIDINLNLNSSAPFIDWLHINSISYHPDLDQIMFSCNSINEIFIIDHSLDTESTTSSVGGNSGMGGDIIYRWGSPENYGSEGNRILAKQHDAKWVLNDSGQHVDAFTVFNNGLSSTSGNYSALLEVSLARQGFTYGEGSESSEILWSYNLENSEGLYSRRMSGLTKLANGHVVFCEADSGTFFEIDKTSALLWKYINPTSGNSVLSQGDMPRSNIVFNVYPYQKDFFDDVQLNNSQTKVEANWTEDCFYLSANSNLEVEETSIIELSGNVIKFKNLIQDDIRVQVIDMSGKIIHNQITCIDSRFDISHLPRGIYVASYRYGNKIATKMISKI